MMTYFQRTVATVTGAFVSRDNAQDYQSIPQDGLEDDNAETPVIDNKKPRYHSIRQGAIISAIILGAVLFAYWFAVTTGIMKSHVRPCGNVEQGYQCDSKISHFWGQYSPYFAVPSKISADVPRHCKVNFAQILSRHGARDPTSNKRVKYAELIQNIQSNVTTYKGKYAFLKDYTFTLGADQLTVFGEQEMINSGIKYYWRYKQLTRDIVPFVRASGEERVIESAQNWTQGFHSARTADRKALPDTTYPYPIVTISEAAGSNNTLSYGLCNAFTNSTTGVDAQNDFADIFVPPIRDRLNKQLKGLHLTREHTIYFMDMCPFDTVASALGTPSPFCHLFTTAEWHNYDYYQSLGKYYGFGWGNKLAPTQGVGFTNELIARLTNKPVKDHTSTNSTLDDSPTTFPLGAQLYADFSHDNDMSTIFAALGLYNETQPLRKKHLQTTKKTKGYSAGWTVPFAGRAYFEKLDCKGEAEELVRVVINDRVLPLHTCGGDKLGRCTVSKFVDSLSFAQNGGDWDKC